MLVILLVVLEVIKFKNLRRIALTVHKTAPATPSLPPFMCLLFLYPIQPPNPQKKQQQHNYVNNNNDDNHDNDNNTTTQQDCG